MAGNYCYNCFAMRAGEGLCPHCGYDPEWDKNRHPNALPHGSVLAGRYVIGRVLGQGGFGITYVALERSTNQKRAVKEYLPASAAHRMQGTSLVTANAGGGEASFRYGMERFLEEAEVLAKFSGVPNIAAVRSFFQENGTAYFIMDYVEGISFKTYLRNHGGRVSWQEAVNILRPVMKALGTVHQAGIIHRDVALDNIYIAGDGGVKLLDFGSARYSLGDRSKTLDVVLRPGYAPREQYRSRSRQGPFTDVYSLAACFYAAITGYLPPESLEREERDELASISRYGIQLPLKLESAIYKGLAVKAENRFQTMEEFLKAIDPGTVESSASSAPNRSLPDSLAGSAPGFEPDRTSPAVSRRMPVVICIALCAVGGAAAFWLLFSGSLLGILAAAIAAASGAAAVVLTRRQTGDRGEPLYREACAAYGTGNYQTAVQLFQQAARAGNNRAKFCLGECFRWGNGVPQSMEAAFKWYLAAARDGNEDAYYSVGCCYYAGDGVAADRTESVRWLEKAAASHSGAAAAARRMLEALRTPGK